jgi:hypothetical protein
MVKDNEIHGYYNGKTYTLLKWNIFQNLTFLSDWLDQEINKKQRGRRDHRNNRVNQQNTLARRGDISVIHGDCDGKIFDIEYFMMYIL